MSLRYLTYWFGALPILLASLFLGYALYGDYVGPVPYGQWVRMGLSAEVAFGFLIVIAALFRRAAMKELRGRERDHDRVHVILDQIGLPHVHRMIHEKAQYALACFKENIELQKPTEEEFEEETSKKLVERRAKAQEKANKAKNEFWDFLSFCREIGIFVPNQKKIRWYADHEPGSGWKP